MDGNHLKCDILFSTEFDMVVALLLVISIKPDLFFVMYSAEHDISVQPMLMLT